MHYGIGVMLLTGLVVILLAFKGIAPGDTIAARGIATALGSALALVGYVVWPSWEDAQIAGGHRSDSAKRPACSRSTLTPITCRATGRTWPGSTATSVSR